MSDQHVAQNPQDIASYGVLHDGTKVIVYSDGLVLIIGYDRSAKAYFRITDFSIVPVNTPVDIANREFGNLNYPTD
jgi:hypothetical protein